MLPKATALIANDPNYEFNLNYSIPRIAEFVLNITID